MHFFAEQLAVFVAAFGLLLFVSTGRAAVWYVDPASFGPTHGGTSWVKARTSLGRISGVIAGDTVYNSFLPLQIAKFFDSRPSLDAKRTEKRPRSVKMTSGRVNTMSISAYWASNFC